MNTRVQFSTTFYLSVALLFLSTSISFSQYNLTQQQSIATNGANDSKSFVIDGTTYLAIANYQDNSTVELNSAIYKWENNQFTLFQELSTKGASDWEFFTIESQHYLATANYKSQTNYEINSTIYKWNGDSMIVFQDIPTSAAYDWESFTINDTVYLAVANQLNGAGGSSTNSTIYKWNGTQFDSIQSILTSGATDWEAFTIQDSLHFIGIANAYGVSAELFKWNGTQFVTYQAIISIATTGIETFVIDNEYYLATSNGRSFSSYFTNSQIFKWNGTQFISHQLIPTVGAFDWEYFLMDNQHFLCVANYQDDNVNYDLESVIYRWNGSTFVAMQNILTHAAVDWEYMQIDNTNYLFVSEYKSGAEHNIDSRLFVLEGDGSFLNELENGKKISVNLMPNPAEDRFTVTFNSIKTGIATIEILNSTGSSVHSELVANNAFERTHVNVELPKLESGLYFCRVRIGEESTTQKLMVK